MENQLHVQMWMTQRSLWQYLREISDDCGLLPGQPKVLEYLAVHPGCSRRDIGILWNIDKATLSGILNRMERDGLLTVQESESDRRRKKLNITEKGQIAYEKMQAMIEKLNVQASAGISADEMDAFMATLARIRRNMADFHISDKI
ncbi:MAG: MarR family transcriptional regulator [Oscillospiraceae bacterium]|nr:MarR family transcriptional regulator [Oscillospiraceae bacterium]